jgi:hypothetical protein
MADGDPLGSEMDDAMNKMLAVSSTSMTVTGPARTGDDALLERMRLDDVDAYRTLVERHIDHAYAVAMRVLKNPADADGPYSRPGCIG